MGVLEVSNASVLYYDGLEITMRAQGTFGIRYASRNPIYCKKYMPKIHVRM